MKGVQMLNILIICSNIAAASVRGIVCLFFLSRLLSARKPEKKSIVTASIGIAVISVILPMIGLPDFYRMGLETILLAICASQFQNADTRMGLFVIIFYELGISFWQFLFAAWLGVFFHSTLFLNVQTGNGQVAVWLLHLLLIVLTWYLIKHPNTTERENFRLASVIAVAGFVAVISLSEQKTLTIADDTLDMWTILSVVLMMSVLIFNINRQYEVEKELARLKSEQAELLERDYTTLNHAYAINAKLFHDFHNHIGVLRQLLSHKKSAEAMQYLDELQLPVQAMTDTIWTGDETVDYLINSKAVTAEEHDIKYQVQVEFPRHTNLRSADLCAILGNLLDNALEATKQQHASEERFIRLTIRRIHQMIVIKVENSFSTAPIETNGTLKTAKDESGLHGWGLKSAQTAAEKYDGMLQTSYTDHTFTAIVTLSFVVKNLPFTDISA